MKHKLIITFLVLNEVSAVALAATKSDGRAIGQTIMGAVGLALGIGILWVFTRLGMFQGLKFRHWLFIMLCVILALALGYHCGQISLR